MEIHQQNIALKRYSLKGKFNIHFILFIRCMNKMNELNSYFILSEKKGISKMRKQDKKDGSSLPEIAKIRQGLRKVITGSYGLTSREQLKLCAIENELCKLMCEIETEEKENK